MEFLKALNRVRIHRMRAADADEQTARVEKGRAVRLYHAAREDWALQVRGPLGIGPSGLKDSRDFIVATAHLDRTALASLRDAIDNALAEG